MCVCVAARTYGALHLRSVVYWFKVLDPKEMFVCVCVCVCVCVATQTECTFSGVWRGLRPQDAPYYISSYFWDRAFDTGIIKDERAAVWTTSPSVSGVCTHTCTHTHARTHTRARANTHRDEKGRASRSVDTQPLGECDLHTHRRARARAPKQVNRNY